jgi:hypothetical protein
LQLLDLLKLLSERLALGNKSRAQFSSLVKTSICLG